MTISSSLNLPELLFSPSQDSLHDIIFILFHSPITLSISSVLFLSYPLFLLSLHQSIILSAEVYRHRYPFCFTFLSHLLSLSFNNLLSSITHFYLLPLWQHFSWDKNKVIICDRSEPAACRNGICVLFTATAHLLFCLWNFKASLKLRFGVCQESIQLSTKILRGLSVWAILLKGGSNVGSYDYME